MTARVLVVDDIPANVKLLEARLSAEYFDVVTAMSGQEALAICERAECDLVLLDVMMPDMDGFEVCRRLKTNPATHHIPVVMVTALDQSSDRVRGLEAGADDFLTKPIPELALLARVRSLARLKMVTDELRMRALTSRDIGIESPEREAVADAGRGGRVLIVDDRPASYERVAAMLATEQSVEIEADPNEALFRAADGNYDLLIVSAVQSDTLARPHPQRAHSGDQRARQQRPHGARPRNRRERLFDAPDREERAVGAGAQSGAQTPLHGAAARQCPNLDRDGDYRCADRPFQSPLHGKSPGHAGGAGRCARQAACSAGARH
jgi:DNA-binding response OmpR family regulator